MSNLHKVLVIEDEQNICNFLRTVLETHDYQVLKASNGSNGKTMFLSHNPDLVILDLGLPDMDGTELIKVIRMDSEVPIIVLSARSNEKDKVLSLDLGANDYVTKPIGTEELLSIHAGRVLTYAEIVKKVWGYSDSGSIKKLQVNMANIRKKFGEKPGEYRYILNELGVGYRMNADTEEITE